MSYAILELDLRLPPATVQHIHTLTGDLWVATCGECGRHGRAYRYLSAALVGQEKHGATHIEDFEEDLTDLLSTVARPLLVTAARAS